MDPIGIGKISGPCGICGINNALYKCPKCGVVYCSQACFRKEAHGECSELFFRDLVYSSLQSSEAGGAQREAMLDLLSELEKQYEEDAETMEHVLKNVARASRMASHGDSPADARDDGDANGGEDNEGEDEQDGLPALEDRMKGLDLNTASVDDILSRLTERERDEFHKAVQDGRIANVVSLQSWKPWWMPVSGAVSKGKRPLVEIVSQHEEPPTETPIPEEELPTPIPAALTGLAALESLLGPNKRPSPELCFNLLDALFAYAYCMRLYNADTHSLGLEIAESTVELSPVLSENKVHAGVQACVSQILLKLHSPTLKHLFHSSVFEAAVLQDVAMIVSKQEFVLAALSHMHALLDAAIKHHREQLALKRVVAAKTPRQEHPQAPSRRGGELRTVNDLLDSYNAGVSTQKLVGTAATADYQADATVAQAKDALRLLTLAQKKIYFYASWAASSLTAISCRVLAASMSSEHSVRLRQAQEHERASQETAERLSAQKRAKEREAVLARTRLPKLIQELN